MYTYLTNTLHTAKIDTLLYVYGITADDCLTKYNLELYYISYDGSFICANKKVQLNFNNHKDK